MNQKQKKRLLVIIAIGTVLIAFALWFANFEGELFGLKIDGLYIRSAGPPTPMPF